MMLGRRLLVLMAVLLGLTALTTSLAPRPGGRPTTPSPSPSPTPTPTARASPSASAPAPSPAEPDVVQRTVDAGRGARFARVRVRRGDTVRLSVRADVLDAVRIDGLDEIEPVEPGVPARFEFLADEAGAHSLVLLDANRRFGVLDVRG